VTTIGLEEARQAWRAGDAERTLALCDALERDRSTATESALLRARVFLRMQRADDARVLLAPLLPHTTGEHAAEVRTLLGTAYARSGDVERGLTLLQEADALSKSDQSRAEIALGVALAHYARRDFALAEKALDAVDPSATAEHARALECRGWIAKCRGAFPAAVSAFEAALAELDRSPQRDDFLEANLVMVLGNLAVELLDSARWDEIERRAERIAWDGIGMSYYRFWHQLNVSMMAEMYGRPREALQAARSAALGSPSNAFRTFAHCRRAAVLLAYEELLGYADLAATIREEFDAIDLSALRAFEEINLAAVVVATLAQIGDADGAAATFARLGAMSPAQLALLTDEPLKRGYLAYVEGLLADANHDAFTAQHRYRESFACSKRSVCRAARCWRACASSRSTEIRRHSPTSTKCRFGCRRRRGCAFAPQRRGSVAVTRFSPSCRARSGMCSRCSTTGDRPPRSPRTAAARRRRSATPFRRCSRRSASTTGLRWSVNAGGARSFPARRRRRGRRGGSAGGRRDGRRDRRRGRRDARVGRNDARPASEHVTTTDGGRNGERDEKCPARPTLRSRTHLGLRRSAHAPVSLARRVKAARIPAA
jgi:tetratricopeptide (TPR) repeat protein